MLIELTSVCTVELYLALILESAFGGNLSVHRFIALFESPNLLDLLDIVSRHLTAINVPDVVLQWSPAPTPPNIMESNNLIVWDNLEIRFGAHAADLAHLLSQSIAHGLQTDRPRTLLRQNWLVRKTGPFRLSADAPSEFPLTAYEHSLVTQFSTIRWRETIMCAVSRERDRVLFLAARAEEDIDPPLYDEIRAIFQAFWYAYHCLFVTSVIGETPGGEVSETSPLSSREIECLHWLAAGKTIAESAIILGISERTLRFHVNNARERLGVATTTQAIVTATLKHGFHTSDARKSVYTISRQK